MRRLAEWCEFVGTDVRHGARRLASAPAFTLAAIATLGLGVGATVAVFSLNYHVLLKPLPYSNPEQLVAIWGDASYRGVPKSNISPPDFLDWQREATTLSGLAAYLEDFGTTATGADGRAERIDIRMVGGNFFRILGASPLLGRVLSEDDDVPGPGGAAVISHRYWQRRFGGRADVIGAVLETEPGRFRIVGVMPRQFQYGAANTDVWFPLRQALSARDWDNRTNYVLDVVGRLKPGVTVAQAQEELDALARALAAAHLSPNEPRGARVLPLREEFAGSVRRAYVMLFAAAGSVLLVACLNVAHLLLLQGLRRNRELAVRASLGATRRRLVQQLLMECALLCVAAGVIGLFVHQWTISYFMRFVPTRMVGVTELSVSGAVLAFTVLAALASVCVAGLMPALRLSSVHLLPAAKGHTSGLGRSRWTLRSALVAGEVTIATLLLVCSTLFVATMWRLYHVDPGFNPSNLLVANVPMRDAAAVERIIARVTAIPEIAAAGVATVAPLDAFPGRMSWTIDGRSPVAAASSEPRALFRTASARYLEALEVPLLRGRWFNDRDRRGTTRVALVNDSMRRRYWSNSDPIGARIRRSEGAASVWYTVVGVVGDVKQRALDVEVEPEVTIPYLQHDGPALIRPRTLVMRTRANAAALAQVVQREIGSLNPTAPLPDVVTMDQMISAGVEDRQRRTMLVSAFSVLALALSILGVYAVVSSAVADRTHEIGIRMALGARPGVLLAMVIREGVALTTIGCVAGLAAALIVTRSLESFLFGVAPTDPVSFASAAVLMLSVAIAASYVPARRTARINLRIALSNE